MTAMRTRTVLGNLGLAALCACGGRRSEATVAQDASPDVEVQPDAAPLDASAPDASAPDASAPDAGGVVGNDAGPARPSARLWILNQGGDPGLAEFFTCLFESTNWDTLAAAYSGAPQLSLGGQVVAQPVASGQYPCTSQVGSQTYYQCAVDAGSFPIAAGDILLVVRPDGAVGGVDNQYSSNPTNISYGPNGGQMSVTSPATHTSVPIVAAHVGDATSSDTRYLFVYAVHEVFEAQTDGISADCCDGETTTAGPVPGCPDCGPYETDGGYGLCGQYSAPGGSWGVASITCPSGRTYWYQQVSPPGAHAYGSPEFDGTCQSIVVAGGQGQNPDPCANVPPSGNGSYCGTSTQNGFGGGAPGTLYDCQNGVTASTTVCQSGCFIAPVGKPDGCN
jgi:hypothetical protein